MQLPSGYVAIITESLKDYPRHHFMLKFLSSFVRSSFKNKTISLSVLFTISSRVLSRDFTSRLRGIVFPGQREELLAN
jgi:hypothetical protein